MPFFRSLLFFLLKVAFTVPFALLVLVLFFLPPLPRYRAITLWARMVVWLARVVVGIRYEVKGLEHLPDEPCVVLAKHQSAWETIVLQTIFHDLIFVWTQEIKWLPFFG